VGGEDQASQGVELATLLKPRRRKVESDGEWGGAMAVRGGWLSERNEADWGGIDEVRELIGVLLQWFLVPQLRFPHVRT
jgi:hypothetical protein